MATVTNSQGLIITHTNECLETVLLQLNASNTYYTSGENDIICIKVGYVYVLRLDHTYHSNRNRFQNYTMNEHTINNYES